MSTLFLLLAEYGTGEIPLERCCKIWGLEPAEAAKRAAKGSLPVPAYRAGSQKSPWLIDAGVLAKHLDEVKAKAAAEWAKLHRAA